MYKYTVPSVRIQSVPGSSRKEVAIEQYSLVSSSFQCFDTVALVTHITHNRFTTLFPGPPDWAGATRELLYFMVQGEINKGRHTDHPVGRHSIRTNQCPPPPSPHIFYGPVSKHWRQSFGDTWYKTLPVTSEALFEKSSGGRELTGNWQTQFCHESGR